MRWYQKAVIGTALTWVGLVLSTGSGCGRSDDVSGTGTGGATSTTTTGGQGGGGAGVDVTEFEACAEAQASASLARVNMFIAIDKSGSMDDNMKWDNTRAAFTAFFQDPAAASLNVALRFWPDDGCDQMTCDVMACATPQVPLGPLSDMAQQQALITLFQAKMPGGNTPVSAALEGAVLWSQNRLMAAPDEAVVIILVTDGEPNGCDENIANIAAIADGAFTSDGIRTYAVGLQGSAEPDMNSIATAGGTNMGIFIGNANAQQDLLDALLNIAGQAVQCTFAVPDPVAGELLDPKLVRVEYGQAGQSNQALLSHVADASECGNGGWYYDDNGDPTSITFCPETCSNVQQDTMAQIDIALGCECDIDADCPDGLICIDHHCVPPCSDDSCPDGEICRDGRCVPAEGDPCQEDSTCPDVQTCNGGQCSYDNGIVVGPFEAVQGGAFSCAVSTRAVSTRAFSIGAVSSARHSNGPSSPTGWLMAALGLAALVRRRHYN
jgi:MYXO-CTERM domain-containing protein